MFKNFVGGVQDILKVAECMLMNVIVTFDDRSGSITRLAISKWCPPTVGWIKINSDGAAAINEEWSKVVGVLRDSNGSWIVGYQRYVGRGSTLTAELWAILHGLQVVKHQRVGKVLVESDCSMAIEMINRCLDEGSAGTIARQIKEMVH